MPNPLTDELTDQQKTELAAKFAEMRARFDSIWGVPAAVAKPWRRTRQVWDLRRGW